MFEEPGEYRIGLVVTDNDGNAGESGAVIRIEPPHTEEIKQEELQKVLYGRLIQRRILCEVYHKVIVSKSAINLTMKDVSDIETYGEFQSKTLNQIGASFERNALILRGIKLMSDTGRRKILFFGCSVEHSRKIAISLKAMYGMRHPLRGLGHGPRLQDSCHPGAFGAARWRCYATSGC